VEELDDLGGLPLGLTEDATNTPAQNQLEPGDGFLVVTDGITEATEPGGAPFGDERLLDFLSANTERGDALLRDLFAHVAAFEENQPAFDDKAVILLELQPAK
jgi:serine phosphatase RsbU (regulator of sigma subunit)